MLPINMRIQHRYKRVLLSLGIVLCVWIGLQHITSPTKRVSEHDLHELPEEVNSAVESNDYFMNTNHSDPPSIILLWTQFFGNAKWDLPKLGRSPFVTRKCRYNNCLVVNKDAYTERADMLLFNCIKEDKRSLPPVRHPRQLYTAYCWEPPSARDMTPFSNLYANMTATYRSDSEVVDWPGKFKVKDTPSPGLYVPKNPFKLKTKTLVWPVSNCNPQNKRDKYVEHLAKHLDVDIYGKCGTLECPRRATECFEKFEKQYKFYISFENSICKDYVTEKFFYPLNYELVPIVLGGADYKKIAPPHSYINVEDYESPRKLAEYLKFLSENEAEYNKYFQWKQTVMPAHHDLWCDLCEAAMTRGSYHKEITPNDLLRWWNDGTCDNNRVQRMLKS